MENETKLYRRKRVSAMTPALDSKRGESMNSRNVIAVTALSFTLFATQLTMAQQQPTQPSDNPSIPSESVPETKGGWPTPEESVNRMSSKLTLTDDQKAKITPIVADRQNQMRALMADTSSRKLQKARKAKSIMSDSDKKIEAVLTKDQKKTYEQMKEERHEQMQSRMQSRMQ
jgi:Spy/CpxP family protein refolding chaperone